MEPVTTSQRSDSNRKVNGNNLIGIQPKNTNPIPKNPNQIVYEEDFATKARKYKKQSVSDLNLQNSNRKNSHQSNSSLINGKPGHRRVKSTCPIPEVFLSQNIKINRSPRLPFLWTTNSNYWRREFCALNTGQAAIKPRKKKQEVFMTETTILPMKSCQRFSDNASGTTAEPGKALPRFPNTADCRSLQ